VPGLLQVDEVGLVESVQVKKYLSLRSDFFS